MKKQATDNITVLRKGTCKNLSEKNTLGGTDKLTANLPESDA